MKYVMLPWSEYHQLVAQPHPRICDSEQEAIDKRESHLDQVLPVADQETAEKATTAFYRLSYAAWSPNQDYDQRAESSDIIRESQEYLDSLKPQ